MTLAFSTFIERIFRVRAEPLSLFFTMLSLLITTNPKQNKNQNFYAGIFTGAAFLTTQKALYFNIALGVAILVNDLLSGSFKYAVKKMAILVAGWFTSLLIYCIYFRGIYFYEVFYTVFTGPLNLAIKGGNYYDNLDQFIIHTLIRNNLLYLLGVLGWLMAGYNFRRMERPERICWIFTGIITFFVFNHSQPWPYVFIWCIPFIAFWSDRTLFFMRFRYRQEIFYAVLGVVAIISFIRNVHYLNHSNTLQHEVVVHTENLLGPEDVYCDGIGMIVNRKQAAMAWWDSQKIIKILHDAESGESRDIKNIFFSQPKVWILTYRTEKLMKVLSHYFKDSYIRIFPNVIICGAPMSSKGETRFINRWEGEYRLFSPEGRPINEVFYLNGRLVKAPVKIPLGESYLKLLKTSEDNFLLPADIRIRFKISTNINKIKLFSYVYEY